MTYPMQFGVGEQRTEPAADLAARIDYEIDHNPDLAVDMLADAAIRTEADAVYLADRYGHKRVVNAILRRVGRAQELMGQAADDLDRALGAIHVINNESGGQ